MLTLADIKAVIETVRTEGAGLTGYDPTRIANDAGRHLYGMWRWNWRDNASVVLEPNSSNSSLELPGDLQEIISATQEDAWRPVQMTTLGRILRLRHQWLSADTFVGAALGFWAAVSTPPGNVTDGLGAPHLEIYPPAGGNERIHVWYRRGWPELSADANKAVLPDYCEPLYLQIVRAFAQGAWVGTQDTTSARLAEIEEGPIYKAAIRTDAEKQPDYGPVQNTAVDMARGAGAYIPIRGVGPPD